jgi:hypothetical protein
MGYVLHGHRLRDHDFPNILMMDSTDAERLDDALRESEMQARRSGNHWNPTPNA